ncbi:MAG: DUF4834 family protein [Paludibacteraceae bacterium]
MFNFILIVLLFLLIYSVISSIFKFIFGKRRVDNDSNDTTIVNNRQPHEKIIRRNEGEYVDFEEIKEEDNATKNADQN